MKEAYLLVQDFRQWYEAKSIGEHPGIIEQLLYRWYEKVELNESKPFESVIKMIEKHEKNILNYFSKGLTNAKSERINGKIQRFISNNYGMRDKDFALYRIQSYCS